MSTTDSNGFKKMIFRIPSLYIFQQANPDFKIQIGNEDATDHLKAELERLYPGKLKVCHITAHGILLEVHEATFMQNGMSSSILEILKCYLRPQIPGRIQVRTFKAIPKP